MSRIACHRDDGELVGYVYEQDGQWVPTTVFGYPLAAGMDRDDAEDLFRGIGMSVLIEKWEYLEDGEWMNAQIVEAKPDHVTIAVMDVDFDERYAATRVVTAPVQERLRLRR